MGLIYTPKLWIPGRGGTKPTDLFALNQQSVLANGLVAWFPFPSNSNLRNYAIEGFRESFTSFTAYSAVSDPIVRNGWYLSAATTIVSDGILSFTTCNQSATFAVWFTKIAAVAANGTFVFSLCDTTTVDYLWSLTGRTGNILRYIRGDVAGNMDSVTLNNGQTYLFVGTTHSAGGETYIDDVAGASSAVAAAATALNPATDAYRIGNGNNPNLVLHDVKVWNRLLSRYEISMLYHPQTRWELHMDHSYLYTGFDVPAPSVLTPYQPWYQRGPVLAQ